MLGWLLKAFFTLALLAGLIVGFAAYKAHQIFTQPLPIEKSMVFEINSGKSLHATARDLVQMDIVETPYAFHFGLHVLSMNAPIKAGEYELTPGMSARDILELFQKGSNFNRLITIREGLTSYEIVQLLKSKDTLTGEVSRIPAEGTLLPETYSHSKKEDRGAFIKRMEDALTNVLDEAWENRVDGLPIKSKKEALILASIIEKETGVADERRKVAGVFINRLRKGMLLQTDPTVIYAITKGEHKNDGKGPLGRRLLRKDLTIDSPYNTYLYAGLPKGPIANAGKASIEAALNPETHDYIYFVADGTGGHLFAKTLAGHNRNVANWRKVRNN